MTVRDSEVASSFRAGVRPEAVRRLSGLELHYIFPKALLQEHGCARAARNAIANYCFLTAGTSFAIGRRPPAEYLPECEARNPGVLASQWIPADPDRWHPERYHDFLDARRHLLSTAANGFLEGLVLGAATPLQRATTEAPHGPVVTDPVALRLSALAAEAVGLGLAAPEVDHEIVDADTGEVQAWADLAWPAGVQTGLTQAVAFVAERDEELERRLGELGWRFFTDEVGLRRYFEEVLGVDLDGDGVVGLVSDPVEQVRDDARCWLVRAHGGRLAPAFERIGVITIGWADIPGLGDLREHDDEEILGLLRDKDHPQQHLRMLRQFHREMAEGDIVVTPATTVGELLVGVVDGPYDYADRRLIHNHRHVRKVRWLGRRPRDQADPDGVTKNRARRTVALLPDQQHWLALARDVAAGRVTAGPSQPADDVGER